MPTAQTRDALLALVERSGLLAPARLDPYRRTGAGTDAPLETARALVRDRLLTQFQARQLLRGRSRGFFLTEKYKILEQLGEGGMGRVFLCEHLLLQKLVAVKMLHPSWVSVPGAEERFLREARASAVVDHPNLVRVFDVDRAAGTPFMVMEHVDGLNLHQLVSEHGPLTAERAAEYARQTAIGLGAAHAAGLVHRDIKPGNLLLDRSGVVKLLDLGLARFMIDAARNNNLTQKFDAGSILGTLDFIAPEQADDSSKADIRADIYSLGHTLYFLLTGRLPFGDGSAAQKLMWHQMRHPEPLSAVRPDLPPDLQTVYERMTRKRPEERYQTPAEVVAALAPLTGTVPPPPAAQMPKFRAAAFLLGVSPPPSRDLLAPPAAPPTPPLSTVETTAAPRPKPADESSSDVLRSAPGTPGTVGAAELLGVPTPPPTELKPRPRRRYFVAAGGLLFAAVVAVAAWQLSRPPEQVVQKTPEPPGPRPVSAPSPKLLPPAVATLTGAGSTFVDPMMQRWAELYRQKANVAIAYTKSGSSAGVREFVSGRVPFACTDAPLTDAQLPDAEAAGGPVLHVPLVMGAVAATYNLPEVSEPLTFTGGALAGIYLGKITHWNDPAIAACNRGVKLPDRPITVIHRQDGSGTTYIWTDYLNKVSGAWKAPTGPGVGNAVRWPVGVGAERNDGVAREVTRTVGAIGYVELSFALAQNLPVARVENREAEYVPPTLAGVTAAATNTMKDVPPDLRFALTDAPGKGSYPIAGTTWAVVFKKQLSANRELREFLRWAVHDGQAHVTELKYAPLPSELVTRIDALSSW
jgi:phosphate ABC transporter phosphate-binding protein